MPVIPGTVTNYLTKLTPFRATEDHHIPHSVTAWVPKVTHKESNCKRKQTQK